MESIRHLYKIGYGPSSSHTMGPERAMRLFLEKYPDAKEIRVNLYGSLALTGKGHLTDYIIKKVAHPREISFRWKPTTFLEEHPNALTIKAMNNGENVAETYFSVGGGDIEIKGDLSDASKRKKVYPHSFFTDIANYCRKENISLLAYINHFDPDLDDYLQEVWEAMQQSIHQGLKSDEYLKGSLHLKRKAKLLYDPNHSPERNMSAYAYAVNEENASATGQVVTAPTCGACGTLPAVLRYAQESMHVSDKEIVDAIKIAGLIGTLIKTNASISGAEAGCQAEVGSATSMAAAALAFLKDDSLHTIEAAAEIAMEHQLGLTCDPVEGYVQIPCIQRNAVAAQKALVAVTLAEDLKDFETVAFDTVVHVMYETGKDLPYAYRETSKGGLAKHYKKKTMC